MENLYLFFALTSFDPPSKADAVVLLEGDGYTRIPKACSLVKEGWSDKLVFSGGIENLTYGSYTFEMCLPRILEEGIDPKFIYHESKSLNTREQADYVIQLCVENNWNHIILVATHYHQYRAFLTFLKVLEERNLLNSIRISNAPATAEWFESNPWGIRADLLKEEFRKIHIYKDKGHISEFETAVEYIKLWSND